MITLDGATGTELGRRGVDTRGRLFSGQALLEPKGIEALRAVHRDYAQAGAQVITANTFRTNPRKAGPRWRELTGLAVRIARETDAVVAGVDGAGRGLLPSRPASVPGGRAARAPGDGAGAGEAGCDLLLVETVAAADEG